MATRKKAPTLLNASTPVAKTAAKKRTKKARWKSTTTFVQRGFFKPKSLAGYMATVEVSEMPYFDEGQKEVEACISIREGSDTIDLSFYARDKKDASRELAQLDQLVKLVSATRDAFSKALNKAIG